jgi:hypothetical protein
MSQSTSFGAATLTLYAQVKRVDGTTAYFKTVGDETIQISAAEYKAHHAPQERCEMANAS